MKTEYAGQDVSRSGDGKLLVGGNSLTEEETEALSNAAEKSLRAMHKSGVLYGDLALRNVRAEKLKEDGTYSSKAWWLDFGQSETGVLPGSTQFMLEQRECKALFTTHLLC